MTEDNESGLIESIWGREGQFRPYDVFGLAASFALYSHGWSEAENFSDLAIRSGLAHGADKETILELHYIRSVARRFVFADERSFYELGVTDNDSRLELICELHSKALSALEKAKLASEDIDSIRLRSLLLSRLGLENASLDLMFLSITHPASVRMGRNKDGKALLERSFERLNRVAKLLLTCDDDRKNDLFEQLDGTLAAAICIDFLVNGSRAKDRILSREFEDRLASIGLCEAHSPERSFHLLTVLFAATRIIRNGPDENCAAAIRQAMKDGQNEPRRLAFDRSLEESVVTALENGGLLT